MMNANLFKKFLVDRYSLSMHTFAIFTFTLICSLVIGKIFIHYGVTSILYRNILVIPLTYSSFYLIMRLWVFFIVNEWQLDPHSIDYKKLVKKERMQREKNGRWNRWNGLWELFANIIAETGIVGVALFVFILVYIIFFNVGPYLLAEFIFDLILSARLMKQIDSIDPNNFNRSFFKKTFFIFILVWGFSMPIIWAINQTCPSRVTVFQIWRTGCSEK